MNTEKFKNKFRIQSNRLSNFDYSSSGAYFVTICANNRENVFGEIVNGEIILNDIGQIVEEEILATEKIRKNVIIDEFVIMPNHVHVIIFLNNEDYNCPARIPVETHCNASLQPQPSLQPFSWQQNYHDRIIRNEQELFKIRKY
ncbi:MAG: transposase, partial [Candidatus Gracilibacteria bacterium]|nr:transposase [Candidatus Gracilibacteria bacterium]